MDFQPEERLDARHGPPVREVLDELAAMLGDDDLRDLVEVARRLLRARQRHDSAPLKG